MNTNSLDLRAANRDPTYEYRVEAVTAGPPAGLQELLCGWGREGWRLHTITMTIVQLSAMRPPGPCWHIVLERPASAVTAARRLMQAEGL